jgi:hypothetical protein
MHNRPSKNSTCNKQRQKQGEWEGRIEISNMAYEYAINNMYNLSCMLQRHTAVKVRYIPITVYSMIPGLALTPMTNVLYQHELSYISSLRTSRWKLEKEWGEKET